VTLVRLDALDRRHPPQVLQIARAVQPSPSLHALLGHSDASMHELLPVQVASHAHEFMHRTRLHAFVPSHRTVHGPAPHLMSSRQLSVPVHCTSHAVAVPHSTCFAHA